MLVSNNRWLASHAPADYTEHLTIKDDTGHLIIKDDTGNLTIKDDTGHVFFCRGSTYS